MLGSPYFRNLFLPLLLLIALSVAGVGVFSALRMRHTYIEGRRQALLDEATLATAILAEEFRADRAEVVGRRISAMGRLHASRVTLIAADGSVLGDNWEDPGVMDNHGLRPEIIEARHRGESFSQRRSDTVHQSMLYYARRLDEFGDPPPYLRIAVPLVDLQRQLRLLYTAIALATVIATLVGGVVLYLLARSRSRPIVEMTAVAQELARGQLDRRIQVKESGEAGQLAAALNAMAASIESLVDQTTHDKAELLTILASMSEGVVATDTRQRIVMTNRAAAELFGFNAAGAQGKPLWQVVRIQEVMRAAEEVLRTRRQRLLDLKTPNGPHMEVCLCSYPLDDAPLRGLVLVARDTTQSVRYQELRKEFVANVSHELRTPLTVIKGFVETLMDGAKDDPVKGPQYLATIERHVNQLTNLVDDLLELSRLESQPFSLRRVDVDLPLVIRKAVELLMSTAERKQQDVRVNVGALPAVKGDPDHLERAVLNLLENAIKYTPAGERIEISARTEGIQVLVEVSDSGIGIPPGDLPRIFERFYRVDRSRSREMGGTGLGLSIVKHIVQSHGGTVDATSTPGQGSTFTMRFPIA